MCVLSPLLTAPHPHASGQVTTGALASQKVPFLFIGQSTPQQSLATNMTAALHSCPQPDHDEMANHFGILRKKRSPHKIKEDKLQQAQATVQIDNDSFRVTEWRFAPGTETGWHRHATDYVVVPMTTGALTLHTEDGDSSNEMTAGTSYTRAAGSEHNVSNTGERDFVFVEIEKK